MDKRDGHIEKVFQDAFDSFELPIQEADFEAIQKMLQQKKRRKLFWWTFSALLCLLLVSLLVVESSINESKNGKQSIIEVESGKENTSQHSAESLHADLNVLDLRKGEVTPEASFSEQNRSTKKETHKAPTNHNEIPFKSTNQTPFIDQFNAIIALQRIGLSPSAFGMGNGFEIPRTLIGHTLPAGAILTPPVDLGDDKNPQPEFWLGISSMRGQSNPTFSNASERFLSATNSSTFSAPVNAFGLDVQWRQNNWQSSLGLGIKTLQTFTEGVTLQLYDSVPVLNPPGDTIGFFRFNFRDSSLNINQNNGFQYVTIPLNLGRSWSIGAKNKLYTGLGISWMHLIDVDSRSINPNLQTLDVNREDYFKQNIISWQLELGYIRQIGQKWELSTGVQYSRPGGGLHTAQAPIRFDLPSTNIYFGCRYRISTPKSSGL